MLLLFAFGFMACGLAAMRQSIRQAVGCVKVGVVLKLFAGLVGHQNVMVYYQKRQLCWQPTSITVLILSCIPGELRFPFERAGMLYQIAI